MTLRSLGLPLVTCAVVLLTGCWNPPGRPGPKPRTETLRPDQVLDFPTLYGQNCAGCHGANGRNGAAISLANPVYLAYAGVDTIAKITAAGIPGTLMPPFSKDSGGLLTERQVRILAQGMVAGWGNAAALGGQTPPPYTTAATGSPADGEKAFAIYCASCHGPDATGTSRGQRQIGSLIDRSYLALISNQGLRSRIVAGAPFQGMPDWRSHAGASPMTDQQITDIVAWLGSFRVQTPGQPYKAHQ
jgi:mono/diheme cytochrome c family protein